MRAPLDLRRKGHPGAERARYRRALPPDETAAVDGGVVAAGRRRPVLRVLAGGVVEHATFAVGAAGGDAVGEVDCFGGPFG